MCKLTCTTGGATSTYTYRADGMRLTKERNNVTTEYLYDGQQPLVELRSDDVRTDYVLGYTGAPMARTVTDGENSATDYYLYDGLGCVMALGNAGFTITQTLEYDVWGSQRAGQGTSSNALKYVGALGHPSDDGTGLIYMRARYYDPDVGRFVSEDPARQGANWYAYASNDPVSRVDRDGKISEEAAAFWDTMFWFAMAFAWMGRGFWFDMEARKLDALGDAAARVGMAKEAIQAKIGANRARVTAAQCVVAAYACIFAGYDSWMVYLGLAEGDYPPGWHEEYDC